MKINSGSDVERCVGCTLVRKLLQTILLCGLSAVLASCGEEKHSSVDVGLLSTDIHVSIAQHTLVLPFIALENYAYRKQSFSLNREGDRERARSALDQFLHDSADPGKPLVLDNLSVVVRPYGLNDNDIGQRQVCALLTREWARSVCDNPWAAIQQALPSDRFRLVDLRRLQVGEPHGPAKCRDDGKPYRPLPQRRGEAVMVCEAPVYGGRDNQYYYAVVRIDGDLGALWTVRRHGRNGETAEAMTEREGKAIVAFVQYGLEENENFQDLHAAMCRLRRPGSADHPFGPDCGHADISALNARKPQSVGRQ